RTEALAVFRHEFPVHGELGHRQPVAGRGDAAQQMVQPTRAVLGAHEARRSSVGNSSLTVVLSARANRARSSGLGSARPFSKNERRVTFTRAFCASASCEMSRCARKTRS